MVNRLLSLSLVVFISITLLSSCQSSGVKDVDPAKSDQWELVAKVSGHETHSSERFEVDGNQLMMTYEAKATKGFDHCSLKAYIVKGAEEMFENPVLGLLNNTDVKGKKLIQRKPGESYYLRVKPLEMHYSVKIFRRKDRPTSTT